MTAAMDAPDFRAIHRRMQATAGHLRLPFRHHVWRGQSGNWLGAGLGSSIDFQDHRPYLPGDDPRYIDWKAYARTGHYTMKLYREEVSPTVDVVFDASVSMAFEEDKRDRALELFYFTIESALQDGASLRAYLVRGAEHRVLALEAILRHRWLPDPAPGPPAASASLEPPAPHLHRIPWRQGSLRVVVSDLLFTGSPERILQTLVAGKGRGMIFAPFCAAEADPDWLGNIDFIDCESDRRRIQRVESELLARYKKAYLRHFEFWKEHCRRHAVVIARVPAAQEFRDAVCLEALGAGAVEIV